MEDLRSARKVIRDYERKMAKKRGKKPKKKKVRSIKFGSVSDTIPNAWYLYFDGSCEPINPGGTASYGWALVNPRGEVIVSESGIICMGKAATNNVAEWGALEAGLRYLSRRRLKFPLICRGDSRLVVNQVTGWWGFRKMHLKVWADKVWKLLEDVGNPWAIEWIPREQNSVADALSKAHLTTAPNYR